DALPIWLIAHLGRWLPALVAVLGLAVLALGVVLALVTASLAAVVPIIVVALILAAALLAAAFWLAKVQQVYSAGAAMSFASLTEAAIQDAPAATAFKVMAPPSGLGGFGTLTDTVPGAPAAPPVTGGTVPGDTQAGGQFRVAGGPAFAAV